VIWEAVITLELNERYISAYPSPVCLVTTESLASRGRMLLTCATFDKTSVMARSGSASSFRLSVTVLTF
jgi:hypothetical protein